MPSAESVLESELEDVRKKLAGYDDLKAQEERLSAALAALRGDVRPAANRAPTPSRGRRTATGIDDGAIIHAIHTFGEPAGAIDIRQSLGLPDSASNSLSIKLKKMVDEGTLKRIGERRASRYTVVS
jgi:hypothetical protein